MAVTEWMTADADPYGACARLQAADPLHLYTVEENRRVQPTRFRVIAAARGIPVADPNGPS